MIPYILHVALLISVCLLFYKLLLQRETFYRLNRLVLIFCLALSFALPFISIPQQWSLRNSITPTIVNQDEVKPPQPIVVDPQPEAVQPETPVKISHPIFKIKTIEVPRINPATATAVATTTATPPSVPLMQIVLKWLFFIYWIGVAAFGLNLLLQVVVLLYQAYTKPVIKDGRYRIVELTGDKAPCSFGNNIFINPEKYDWDTYSQILLHEKIHIQQRHSFDIILAELVLVLQWFNPFAWIYRTELENNLEFLTDDAVLGHKEVERESYQMSLLKVSAPHLSLGITTNYNQSLLKKRILMMNSKKSNIHIMWKYFFLVPLLGILACALNNPMAYSQVTKAKVKVKSTNPVHRNNYHTDRTQGVWFATIKNEKVNIEFKGDDDDHNWSNSSTFLLSELPALPRDQKGDFTLKREAGSVLFNGKFEGNEGYGHYKFTADKSFDAYLKQAGITEAGDDDDYFAFFMVNVTKEYIAMVKRNGYTDLSKNNIISMAALKVDEPYIKMWKANGFSGITPNELVSGKALHIDNAYVEEIRKAGYKDLSFNQLISFKAQHITGAYINSLRKAKLKDGKGYGEDSMPSPNEISSYKAMNIDSNFVRSFAAMGYKNLSYSQLTSLKALNITPEYVKGFKAIGYDYPAVNVLTSFKSMGITPDYVKGFNAVGYNNLAATVLTSFKSMGITPEYIQGFNAVGYNNLAASVLTSFKSMGITPDYVKGFKAVGYDNLAASVLTSFKSLDITPEYIKGFEAMGYKNLSASSLSSLKALGITGDYIKGFEAVGYKNIPVNHLSSLKALGVTPDFVKGFKDLGFNDISVNELSSLKATGVTPAYIKEMRGKGFNSNDVDKYIRLKNSFE
ncbi:M56 family metallopeptidase [Mucilaginibacter sp.]|uniref:M56 family metallopeptidase n=1 Tax=Mucilaginibacter sp. TaxID=1882438 RepID=UPI0025D92C98|nr:M56 family metallopeptidase [Mucilaginibacter sp.]